VVFNSSIKRMALLVKWSGKGTFPRRRSRFERGKKQPFRAA